MGKFKLILKISISFFFFIISSSVIIQWIVTVPNPLGLGFITPESQDTWINFFGAVIGGGATLVGVWWTIKDQEKQRRDDLAIQFKPMLIFEEPRIIKNNKTPIINEEFYFQIKCNEKKLNTHKILIELKNVGFGEGYITKLDINSLNNAPIKGTNTFIQKISKTSETKPIVHVNGVLKFGITIEENILDNISEELIFKATITYRDLFNRHIYAKDYDFYFNISVKSNKRTINYIGFKGDDSQPQ